MYLVSYVELLELSTDMLLEQLLSVYLLSYDEIMELEIDRI